MTKLNSESPDQALSLALSLMELEKYSDARWVLDQGEKSFKASGNPNPISAAYFQLNRMQIKLHQGKALSDKDLKTLTKIRTIDSPYTKMAVAILREKWADAETQLGLCLKTGPGGRRGINTWPIIELLRPHIKNSRIKTRLEASK